MSVDVVIEDTRWEGAGLEKLAERAVRATLAHQNVVGEVVVMGCDDARIAALNGDFRDKAQPTNVLSWPSEDLAASNAGAPPSPPSDPELGDIAIAFDTCIREADSARVTLLDHVTHLVIHATLHLLGYDHERPADADLMEGLEIEILASLGLPDPYSR